MIWLEKVNKKKQKVRKLLTHFPLNWASEIVNFQSLYLSDGWTYRARSGPIGTFISPSTIFCAYLNTSLLGPPCIDTLIKILSYDRYFTLREDFKNIILLLLHSLNNQLRNKICLTHYNRKVL